jgi:hypothetical protein
VTNWLEQLGRGDRTVGRAKRISFLHPSPRSAILFPCRGSSRLIWDVPLRSCQNRSHQTHQVLYSKDLISTMFKFYTSYALRLAVSLNHACRQISVICNDILSQYASRFPQHLNLKENSVYFNFFSKPRG